jgi:hypothetical protein
LYTPASISLRISAKRIRKLVLLHFARPAVNIPTNPLALSLPNRIKGFRFDIVKEGHRAIKVAKSFTPANATKKIMWEM